MKLFYEIALTCFVISCLIGIQIGRGQDTYAYCSTQITKQIVTALNENAITNYTTQMEISLQGQGFFINSTVSKDCGKFVPQYGSRLTDIAYGLIILLALTWIMAIPGNPVSVSIKRLEERFKRERENANRNRTPPEGDERSGPTAPPSEGI